jgi:hypothetical protein
MQKRNIKIVFYSFLRFLNKEINQNGERVPLQSCGNCIRAFREKHKRSVVVCLPYLKTMPADNELVCGLYLMDDRKR